MGGTAQGRRGTEPWRASVGQSAPGFLAVAAGRAHKRPLFTLDPEPPRTGRLVNMFKSATQSATLLEASR